MFKLSVFASAVIPLSYKQDNGIENYNVTVEQAKAFGMKVTPAQDDSRGIQLVIFTNTLTQAVHSERLVPFVFSGDTPRTQEHVDNPPTGIQWMVRREGPESPFHFANLVELIKGKHVFEVRVVYKDSTAATEKRIVCINVGEENWVTAPPASDEPSQDEPVVPLMQRTQFFATNMVIPFSAHEDVSGIPFEKANEFHTAFLEFVKPFWREGVCPDGEEMGENHDSSEEGS